MQADFVAVPPFWTVGQVIDFARDTEDLPDTFSEIFVVDPGFHLLGSIDISRLLRSKRDVPVDTIMETDRHQVLATADQEAVARQFERYGLMAAPVVDRNDRLVGVVTVDDVVEVIEQEADEDAKLLAGVGDEQVTDSVRQITPPRFAWLFVNLLTAILASSVISLFDATIEQHGGARRADADRRLHGRQRRHADHDGRRARACHAPADPGQRRARRLPRDGGGADQRRRLRADHGADRGRLVRHGPARVGDRHGDDHKSLGGRARRHLHPADAHRMGFDPAVASTVFVTTVTDVVGFFAFLGLASLWLT